MNTKITDWFNSNSNLTNNKSISKQENNSTDNSLLGKKRENYDDFLMNPETISVTTLIKKSEAIQSSIIRSLPKEKIQLLLASLSLPKKTIEKEDLKYDDNSFNENLLTIRTEKSDREKSKESLIDNTDINNENDNPHSSIIISNYKNFNHLDQTDSKNNNNLKPNSSKPLWIEQVKKVHTQVMPNLSLQELENLDLIETNVNSLLNNNSNNNENNYLGDYPLFIGIKKLLIAFGDSNNPNQETVIYSHNKLKEFFIIMLRILEKCELTKILEHLYSNEFNKFMKFKKSKLAKSLTPDIYGKDEIENSVNDFYMLIDDDKIKKKMEKDSNKNKKTKKNKSSKLNAISNFSNNDLQQKEFSLQKNTNILSSDNNEEDEDMELFSSLYNEEIENDDQLIEKEEYKEILEFENERANYLSNEEYLDINEARINFFGSKTKKPLLKYFELICDEEKIDLSNELKVPGNTELLTFITKKRLKKIVLNANRNRNNGKLKILSKPLRKEELEEEFEEEILYLKDFYHDFNQSIYLIQAFTKKKNGASSNNKFIKIVREDEEFVIVIKKLIFVSEKEANYLNKIKGKAEKKMLKFFKQKDYFSHKEKDKSGFKLYITKEKLVKELEVDNYYEFYLLNFFVKDLMANSIYNIKNNSSNALTCDDALDKDKEDIYLINKNNVHKLDKNFLKEKYNDYLIVLKEDDRDIIKAKFEIFSN